MRTLFAVIAAIIVGGLTIMGFEMIGHSFHPFPEGAGFEDAELVAKHVATAPLSAVLMVVIGHFVAGILGNIVAHLIGQKKRLPVIIFSVLLLTGTVMNLFVITHPVWFVIVDICAVVLAIFIVFKLTKKQA